MSAFNASVDSLLSVHATTNAPLALAYGNNVVSSTVSPLLVSITNTSPACTFPMSPCSASTGANHIDRVPVLARVWQTFFAMKDVLPTPVNSVVPWQSMIFWQNSDTSSKESWRGCARGWRRRG